MDIGLGEILGEIIEVSLKTKDYHWNLRGREFLFLHPKLDELHDDVQEYADNLAERARAIGQHIDGRVSYEYAAAPVSFDVVVNDLKSQLGHTSRLIQSMLEDYEDDLATQDVLIEIQRGLDKWVWMLDESAA